MKEINPPPQKKKIRGGVLWGKTFAAPAASDGNQMEERERSRAAVSGCIRFPVGNSVQTTIMREVMQESCCLYNGLICLKKKKNLCTFAP